jgi:ABC-type transporter Mla subunit MlaD
MRAHEDDDKQPTLIDRLNGISDRLAKRSTEIKLVAEAAAPLYASLDDEQKRIFGALLRDLRREGRRGAHHWR